MCAMAARLGRVLWAPMKAACRSSFCSPPQCVMNFGQLRLLQATCTRDLLFCSLERMLQVPKVMATRCHAQAPSWNPARGVTYVLVLQLLTSQVTHKALVSKIGIHRRMGNSHMTLC